MENKTMPNQTAIRDEVTARIVQALEAEPRLPGDDLGGRPSTAPSRGGTAMSPD